ncbi:MAG: DUF5805 domain-containing protein [Haloarculaceae archaeon]|jgi:hypothetical protein
MADEDERVTVRTYVPAWQRERWREEADDRGMSQSEFVRTMVQAGRRGFGTGEPGSSGSNPVEGDDRDATPGVETGGRPLEERVLELVEREGPLEWDGLVDGLVGDFEDRLEEALDDLQSANRLKHSGRAGGYVIDDGR